MIRLKITRFLKLCIIALFFLSVFTGCTNFHEVTPGVLYRSMQLSGSQFDHIIKRYGIKTVINLRGEALGDKWYQDEMNVMQMDSITHLDIHISAIQYVLPQKVDSIIGVATSTAKPILVHCQGGADRTGLFCAAWKLKTENTTTEKASKQLSFIYGHIPILKWSKRAAMDSSFRDYARMLNK